MIKEHKAIIGDKGTNRSSNRIKKTNVTSKSKGGGMGDYVNSNTEESDVESEEEEREEHCHTRLQKLNPRERYMKDKMGRA